MKGLLLKDFYMVIKYCRSYLLVVAIFLATALFGNNASFFMTFPCIFAGMMPVTLMAYDDRMRWSTYCGVLPYTRKQLVCAKYIIGLLAMMAVWAVTAVVLLIAESNRLVTGQEAISFLAVAFSAGLIAAALLLPCLYRFGVEKGRVFYYVVLMLLGGASGAAANREVLTAVNMNAAWMLALLPAAALALYALSCALSIAIYSKKEL